MFRKAKNPPHQGSFAAAAGQLELANRQVAWHYRWTEGRLSSTRLDNRLTSRSFPLFAGPELALIFSAATDRVAEPLLRVDDFTLRSVRRAGAAGAIFALHSPLTGLAVSLTIRLDGPTRRKSITFKNTTGRELLLLDVELDDFHFPDATGGGLGQPVFIDEEVFAAMEHPSGDNRLAAGRVRLAHYPGRRLAIGAAFHSHPALVSVAPTGSARAHFLAYLEARSRPRKGLIGVYTPFGINNQWGACPTLDDEQVLDVMEHLGQLAKRGVTFDYFTLDTGWVDPGSDLTRFKPTAFPRGPGEIIKRVRSLHLKFGLWFATSWGLQSCWDYPGAFPDGRPPTQLYREGYPLGADGLTFCMGEERYRAILRKAVFHHVRKNGVRFLKFDGGSYSCDNPAHGHLPGKYSVESMHEWLIDLARRARAIAPDVFIMWYWGLRSPFWVLHGDAIFESGLQMEGSGTSAFPTLHYRDSVTLAQDQNAHHAQTIPPRLKDSLGVWLSDTRWGNFMGAERWRESLVMDLGRGSRLFPNLWGNLRHLTDDDIEFLAALLRLARKSASLFQRRRTIGGDPFRNEVYGYAYGRGSRSLVFVSNTHFASREITLRLDSELGLEGRAGSPVQVVSHFPDHQQLGQSGSRRLQLGDPLKVCLRPFETLLLEVTPSLRAGRGLAPRALSKAQANQLGLMVPLQAAAHDPRLEVRFADAALFAQKNLARTTDTYAGRLPGLAGPEQPILVIAIRLRQGEAEWKYAPTVVQIVQVLAVIGEQKVQLIPMPDGRQHGNTQSFGCSWLTYRVRLSPQWSHAPLKFSVCANLPAGVVAKVEAWVVRRWWQENSRPTADGYYTYALS